MGQVTTETGKTYEGKAILRKIFEQISLTCQHLRSILFAIRQIEHCISSSTRYWRSHFFKFISDFNQCYSLRQTNLRADSKMFIVISSISRICQPNHSQVLIKIGLYTCIQKCECAYVCLRASTMFRKRKVLLINPQTIVSFTPTQCS